MQSTWLADSIGGLVSIDRGTSALASNEKPAALNSSWAQKCNHCFEYHSNVSGVIDAAAVPVSGLCLPERMDRHTSGRQNQKFVHMLDRSIGALILHACTLDV